MRRRDVPVALYAGFGLFLVVIAFLVASSVSKRDVPSFAASPLSRVRTADWARTGDTITIDASDDGRWRLVSFSKGTVVARGDASDWTIGVERYRVMVNGEAADAGSASFDAVSIPNSSAFVGAESLGD